MRIFITPLLLFTLVLAGCSNIPMPDNPLFDVITGSGNATTETRDVANFTSISFADDGELIVTQDGTESLTIEADDNVLPAIETTVRNGTLIIEIRDGTDLRPVTPIRYMLSVTQLQELKMLGDGTTTASALESEQLSLKLHGDGNVVVDAITATTSAIELTGDGQIIVNTLDAQELTTTISGDGQVTVAGDVPAQSLTISGDGNYIADQLRSNHGQINVNGDGEISVWTVETLDVELGGNTNVSYTGSPEIHQTIHGDGQLVSAVGE